MKRIYKYGTGSEVPDGSVYLYTLVSGPFVWHYFLVDVKDDNGKTEEA